MSEKWYVVHVTTSFEDTVKRYIFEQMKLDNCPGLISDVLVPTETLEEQLKGGKKKKRCEDEVREPCAMRRVHNVNVQ